MTDAYLKAYGPFQTSVVGGDDTAPKGFKFQRKLCKDYGVSSQVAFQIWQRSEELRDEFTKAEKASAKARIRDQLETQSPYLGKKDMKQAVRERVNAFMEAADESIKSRARNTAIGEFDEAIRAARREREERRNRDGFNGGGDRSWRNWGHGD